MIKCVNWLLTRKCNLSCDYCRITRNNKNSPYPNIDYFLKNEMSTDFILKGLEYFKNHNPDCFHIFMGGEPILRSDFPDIINYCNKNNIFYTIISNNTDQIQDKTKRLFSKVEYVAGFTFSVDPIIYEKNNSSDRFRKSQQGLNNLMKYKNGIKDKVAEITVDNENLKYLIPLIEDLTPKNICSDITFMDIAKNKYYDFSNITDSSLLVQKSEKLLEIFDYIIKNNLNVHMKDILLPRIFNILPTNLNCEIQNNVHNLTIDSDGSPRLCLRIRGINVPKKNLFSYLNSDGKLSKMLINNIKIDKANYCRGCNWTCPLMSDLNNEMIHIKEKI